MTSLESWIVGQGLSGSSVASLLSGFAEQLLAEGIPVVRAYLALPTVNPTIRVHNRTWTRSTGTVIEDCVSAWNKDPVFGVIGIQSGPRDKGPQWLPSNHGRRGWDACGGDDCEDPSRLFCSWSADQGDLPRAWRIAQSSPQGHPFRGDGVPVRARDAAASEDGPLECRA